MLFVLGTLVLAFECGGVKRPLIRAGTAALCIVFSLRYLYWRYAYSLPQDQNVWQSVWVYLFLAIETGSVLRSVFTCFFLSRTVCRSAEADARQDSAAQRRPTPRITHTWAIWELRRQAPSSSRRSEVHLRTDWLTMSDF